MSNINTGGQAFPRPMGETRNKETNLPLYDKGDKGMTLRDYFAAKAMQGTVANSSNSPIFTHSDAAYCYIIADAMLSARGTGEERKA
jgi:hypothetical protein